MTSNYIIWVGNVFEKDEFIHNPAISPAANDWQSNAITSIRILGVDVLTMSFEQAQVWPKERIFVRGYKLKLIFFSFIYIRILKLQKNTSIDFDAKKLN